MPSSSFPPYPRSPPISQSQAAQLMYDTRAPQYENSWHPAYSARLMRLVSARPSDRVLVLACGSGLESFIAAHDVGPDGEVVGVDVSEGMLAQARTRQATETELGPRIRFLSGDVTDLGAVAGLREGKEEGVGERGFDIIICSSAFVLFEDPAAVVREWRSWLKSGDGKEKRTGSGNGDGDGGRLVIDITHECVFVPGLVIEKVARDMGLKWPSNRLWIKGPESFRHILEAEGYVVERIEVIDGVAGLEVTSYGVDEADRQFEEATKSAAMKWIWEGQDMQRARRLFHEEWRRIAVDGRVEVSDKVYVYIARPA
ncbi:S-adenosyl-L-methionine-dependent methyltransferase [Xylariaceae sp. FL1272]|nr:S-adenosyl-L-methionine-dependent methyltransferase [Xylariaceae sp. FL1272]